LDWVPEVRHILPEGGDHQVLRADALLYYGLAGAGGGQVPLRAFVELDRATTTPEQLARKLINYARFHTYTPQPAAARRRESAAGQPVIVPAWQRHYPLFPRVLFILAAPGPAAAGNRIAELRAMCAEHPLVVAFARQVPLGVATLDDLTAQGPRAAVWTPLAGSDRPRPWTTLTAEASGGGSP
jgi:hypothetical protein